MKTHPDLNKFIALIGAVILTGLPLAEPMKQENR